MTPADKPKTPRPLAGTPEFAAPFRERDTDPELSEVVIRPRSGWIAIDWKEIIHFRELLYYLALRDLKIRYKQTSLGVAWAVLQPLFTMIIVTIIFGRFAKLPSEGVPYAVFVFAGLIPWTFFSNGVTTSGLSLVNQQQMLTKIYFPRLFVPTSAIGVFLVDMMISMGIYAVILIFYRIVPSWQIVFLPPIIILTILATLGLGYTLAASIVLYRDIRHTVPFFMQILMYLSPVIYPISMLSPRYQRILSLNPLCGIIGAYRSSILGTPWDPIELTVSTAMTIALFTFGLYYFRRTERYFADIA